MQFQKGRSGNPGGRRRGVADVKALAATHTREAVETLADIMRTGERASERAAAAIALLDRGHGKPATVVVGDEAAPPVQHKLKAVIEFVRPAASIGTT